MKIVFMTVCLYELACCYLHGIDRKYCAISLQKYRMCVHESLLEAHRWELQSVTSINLCASLNTHKIMGLLEVTSV